MKKNFTFYCLVLITVGLQAQTTVVNISGAKTATWTAPSSGGPFLIRITARGGDGGWYTSWQFNYDNPGGPGATMSGLFIVQNGESILAISGSKGADNLSPTIVGAGGGAGSGAVKIDNSGNRSILILAAGGNGANYSQSTSQAAKITSGSGDGGLVGAGGAGGGGGVNGPGNDYNGSAAGDGVSLTSLSNGGTAREGSGGSGMGGGGAAGTIDGGGGGGQTGGVEGGANGSFGACSLPGGFCQNNIAGSYPATIRKEKDGFVTIDLLTSDAMYYLDNDSDGYGDPDKPIPGLIGCVPQGYVTNSSDCDDSSAKINPATIWYKDMDNDSYSDGASINQCTRPTGYKLSSELASTNGDCDDNDPALTPGTFWYKDADNDGYPDNTAIMQCARPSAVYKLSSELVGTGFANTDCDDNNPAIHSPLTWYIDADNDGYSDGTAVTQCTRPAGYKLSSELKGISGDCNDNNPQLNPETVYYKDADGDGYSDGTFLTQCSLTIDQILEYKLASGLTAISGDCNDNDGTINPTTVWYKDADNDGYSDGTIVTQCEQPAGYKLSSELTATSGDCNDNDGTINPTTVWYKDADNDGYSDGTIVTQCEQPAGYKLSSALTGASGDCNDNDGTINPTTVWYKDADNDGYSDGTTITQCEQPAGYKLSLELTAASGDCNDNNATINPTTVWYKDADNDGYSDGTIVTQCEQPTGYKLSSELKAISGDCNDNNATINPTTVWYKDADNDGYSDGTIVTQCEQPTGYKLSSALTATSGDCNDNNPTINPTTVWYKDADNDGYSDGTTVTQCTRPTGYKLSSELLGITGDCNDNDAAFNLAHTYFLDNDKDGYGNRSIALSSCSSMPPDGYVVNDRDCNDNDPTINPAAVEIYHNYVDDNCNAIVDESTAWLCLNATSTKTTNVTLNSAQLNWSAMANPRQWQLSYKSIAASLEWTDVFLTGNIRTAKITGLQANQRYRWKLRADCNDQWTDFIDAGSFITGDTSAVHNSTPATELAPTLQIYPNPCHHQFVIDLQFLQEVNAIAKIEIINAQGETTLTDNGNIINGRLHKTMTVPSSNSKGLYMVKIIANSEVYVAKLICE